MKIRTRKIVWLVGPAPIERDLVGEQIGEFLGGPSLRRRRIGIAREGIADEVVDEILGQSG